MRKKRLFWQLFISYLLITCLVLLVIGVYTAKSFRTFYYQQSEKELLCRARLIAPQVLQHYQEDRIPSLDLLCKKLGKASSTRITVILPDGKVIADSVVSDPFTMENHADRVEIIEALKGNIGSSLRYSYTTRQNQLYVAIPLKSGSKTIGVLRTSFQVTLIDQTLADGGIRMLLGWGIASVCVALLMLAASRRISRPLEELREGTERFAAGDLRFRLPTGHTQEASVLAEAMNNMAEQLDQRINTAIEQRNEQQAILRSMVEGVFAVSSDERIISMNKAAKVLLNVESQDVKGASIQELIRNHNLQEFVHQALSCSNTIESEIVFQNAEKRNINAYGTPLCNAQNKQIGAVIVLHDVTRLHKLENMRRDFVANVSHELRTPITSIKGFVETLLDGAYEKQQDLQSFLEIIAKQADRLNAIIEDLLTLSRLEQDSERHEISFEPKRIKEILEAAIDVCTKKARDKNIKITLDCSDDITADVNAVLLEQALVNLIDNAIKYSQPESKIQIYSHINDEEVVLSVKDHGCGIEKEHLSRLFERFYRVDKARSRKLGGTGLGLAIVKHIIQAHRGTITVESTQGKGSTFSIHLPCKN